ncbi:MAG: FliM/FliN family flagellar motor switch protein [Vicinamibacterales bacterium]
MADLLTLEGLRAALAGEFRAAVEAVVGQVLTPADVPASTGTGWGVEVVASGVLEGRLTVWIDEAGVSGIARAMMGIDEAPEPNIAADMLRELFSQAASSTSLKDGYEGLTLVSGMPQQGQIPPGGSGIALKDGDTVVAVLTVVGSVARKGTAAASPTSMLPVPVAAASTEYPGNLAALLDIDLPLVVRFARTEMSLRSLSQLGPGSMVDMGRSPDAPVQLLIGSQVVAEGEVVVVQGNYGVRITSLVSPADRLRAMEL